MLNFSGRVAQRLESFLIERLLVQTQGKSVRCMKFEYEAKNIWINKASRDHPANQAVHHSIGR